MKTTDSKISVTQPSKSSPFFSKDRRQGFFGLSQEGISFFSKNSHTDSAVQTRLAPGKQNDKYERSADAMTDKVIQRKCAACEQNENLIQRQEQPEPPETKPVSPDNTQPAAPIPLGRKPRAASCSADPRFPDLGCYGRQLKLDIDENLFNNAHQFNRVATLFPGDNKLMLDTFMRYGIGKNLLETSFGFAGVNKKWGSILSYGTGAALKTYDLLQNGKLKLDIQLPLGKGVNLDIKFDYTAKPENPGEEKGINTVIGVSGSF